MQYSQQYHCSKKSMPTSLCAPKTKNTWYASKLLDNSALIILSVVFLTVLKTLQRLRRVLTYEYTIKRDFAFLIKQQTTFFCRRLYWQPTSFLGLQLTKKQLYFYAYRVKTDNSFRGLQCIENIRFSAYSVMRIIIFLPQSVEQLWNYHCSKV